MNMMRYVYIWEFDPIAMKAHVFIEQYLHFNPYAARIINKLYIRSIDCSSYEEMNQLCWKGK